MLRAVAALLALCLCGCADPGSPVAASTEAEAAQTSAAAGEGPTPTTTLLDDFRDIDVGAGLGEPTPLPTTYARRFTMDRFAGGQTLLCLADGGRYLVVPEGSPTPSGLAPDVVVVECPIRDVYLAASDAMCLFDALDAVAAVSVSGIERDDWSIASARSAMDAGTMAYGGKYRAPDYELLLAQGVRLAIESSMINHVPQVREKLIELGVPVLTELSSYEEDPLGRAEWVRLYGVLLGREDLAEAVFAEQVGRVSAIDPEPTGKTVAFFYLSSAGAAVVRRPGDYVTRMIERAGGSYAFRDLEEARAGSSSMSLTMEAFYAGAHDADVLIYNTSIDGEVQTLADLLDRSPLLADFKAVRDGEVWVTDNDMYQQMLEAGTIMSDVAAALRGQDGGLTFLRRLG